MTITEYYQSKLRNFLINILRHITSALATYYLYYRKSFHNVLLKPEQLYYGPRHGPRDSS